MTDILVADFIKGVFVYLRIAGLLFTAPVLSNRSIPTVAKLVLSLLFTYIVFFMVEDQNFSYEQGLIKFGLIGIKEVITGMIMGFMVNFVFYALSYAGMLISFDMGIGMAQAFDITTESYSNLIGQVLSTIAFLIFLLIDGHHYLFRAMGYSFNIIPLGEYTLEQSVFDAIVHYSAGVFILAVKMASPLMVSFFLIHIAAGIVARISPQMNVFFVMHPLKMGMGFVLIILLIPVYVYIIRNLLEGYENQLFNLVKALGS